MHRHHRLTVAAVLGASLMLIGALVPQAGRAADNRVTDVAYGAQKGAFKVTVVASGAVTAHTNRFPVDQRSDLSDYVVDLSPAAYDGLTKVIAFSKGQIQQVRIGQLSAAPAIMRIVVEARGTPRVDVSRSNGNHEVALSIQTDQSVTAPTSVASATHPAVTKSVVARPGPAAPKTAPKITKTVVAVAPKPKVVAPAPRVVAQATPNPWLPGGKYYCKIPGMPGYRPPHGATSRYGGGGPSAVGAYTGERTVSLDVKDADILDVLRLLAAESGQNIIATQNVKGTTSVSLHNVPLTTALDLVVRTNGLEYRKIGNVYVVGTPADLQAQFGSQGATAGTQTVAFPIKYANPTDLAKQLGTIVPPTAFTVDPRTDTLLVTGSPDIIQSVRNFLALSDVPAPQIVFEVKVLDVTSGKNVNAGINWAGSSPLCLFELPLPPSGASGTATCPATQGSFVNVGGNPNNGGIAPNPFVRTTLLVNGVVNYLLSTNQANLLANPRVAALDNQQASLLVGQTYPIVYYSAQAGNYQVQYIDIGVKLILTPVINTDGYITTTLHVERSLISGFVQQYPILDNRKVDDVLRVKDGDTIVMGGLIDDETTETINKVPLLGDIPVLGAVFRNRQAGKTHNEVVFLITPHLLSEK